MLLSFTLNSTGYVQISESPKFHILVINGLTDHHKLPHATEHRSETTRRFDEP